MIPLFPSFKPENDCNYAPTASNLPNASSYDMSLSVHASCSDTRIAKKREHERKKHKKRREKRKRRTSESESSFSDSSGEEAINAVAYLPNGSIISLGDVSSDRNTIWTIDRYGDQGMLQFGEAYRLDIPNYDVWTGKVLTSSQTITIRANKMRKYQMVQDDSDRYRRLDRYFYNQHPVHGKVLRRSLLQQRSTSRTDLSVSIMLPLPPFLPEGKDELLNDVLRTDSEAGNLSQQYSELVTQSPHDVRCWLQLLEVQAPIIRHQALAAGNIFLSSDISSHATCNKIIYERQMRILHEAIEKNKERAHFCKILYYASIICENGNFENIENILEESVKLCSHAIILKRLRIYQHKVNFPTSNVIHLRNYFENQVCSLLDFVNQQMPRNAGIMSSQYLPARLQSDVDCALVDILADYVNVELAFGYNENAIALVQAIMDLNVNIHHFVKVNFTDVTTSLRQIDKETIFSHFEAFWNSEFPRIGERISGNINADGFRLWNQSNRPPQGHTYLHRDYLCGRDETLGPQEHYECVKETVLKSLGIQQENVVLANSPETIDNETNNAIAAANFMEQMLESHNMYYDSSASTDVRFEWIYSRLHGYKIRVPVAPTDGEPSNVEDMIASEDTGLAYRKILADIKNDDIAYMSSEDILKKYSPKETVDPEYDNPTHKRWGDIEDTCSAFQFLPLRLSHTCDMKALEVQPERGVIFDDLKRRLFCVRSAAGINRLIIRCLKCLGVEIDHTESTLVYSSNVDQNGSVFGSCFLDPSLLSQFALLTLNLSQCTVEQPLDETIYCAYLKHVPDMSNKALRFSALLSLIPYASPIQVYPAVLTNHICYALCGCKDESLLSFILRLLQMCARSNMLSNKNAVLAHCLTLMTYKYSIEKLYIPSSELDETYNAECQRLLQASDYDASVTSTAIPDMQVWNAFVCGQMAIGNIKMAIKVCERSLLSLGSYAVKGNSRSKFLTPSAVTGLQGESSGRDGFRSWSGLISIINVPGALQLYITIVRHFLRLPMNILPHMVLGSEVPNYDAVVALLVQLANGGSDISGVSMTNFLKTKSRRTISNSVFQCCELEKTTVIFTELIKTLMLAMFEDLASERTKQRSELSHNSKRLLDVGRVSSVFLQDEETKTSHNLHNAVYLCAYWLFAVVEYAAAHNLNFSSVSITKCNVVAFVSSLFDVIIDAIKSAYVHEASTIPDIVACAMEKASCSNSRFCYFEQIVSTPDGMMDACLSDAKSLIEAEILICLERLHVSRCEFLLFTSQESSNNTYQITADVIDRQRSSLKLLHRCLLQGVRDFPLNRIMSKLFLCLEMQVCPFTFRPSTPIFPAGGFLRIKQFCSIIKNNYISLTVRYHANILSLCAEILRARQAAYHLHSDGLRSYWSPDDCDRIKNTIEIMMRDSVCRESPILWLFYLRFERCYGKPSTARRLFYRAIEHCAWNKHAWLSCCRHLHRVFTSKELEDIEIMMRDKEILIRVEKQGT